MPLVLDVVQSFVSENRFGFVCLCWLDENHHESVWVSCDGICAVIIWLWLKSLERVTFIGLVLRGCLVDGKPHFIELNMTVLILPFGIIGDKVIRPTIVDAFVLQSYSFFKNNFKIKNKISIVFAEILSRTIHSNEANQFHWNMNFNFWNSMQWFRYVRFKRYEIK